MKTAGFLKYAGQMVFGAVDGLGLIIGMMLAVHSNTKALVYAAVGAGLAEMMSMGAGEWLSESDSDWRESLAIGASTCGVAILPVIPFMLSGGTYAWLLAWLLVLALSGVIVVLRMLTQGLTVWKSCAQTYGLLGAVFVVVGVCSIFLGGA